MTYCDDAKVIASYALEDATADGVVVEIFKNRWGELTGGKPIVATAPLYGEVSHAGLIEIWNAFTAWRKTVLPAQPEEAQLFSTSMNGETVWVVEEAPSS